MYAATVIFACTMLYLARSVRVQSRHQAEMYENFEHRIHVNGIRGKSSVTRLIAASLREGGVKTVEDLADLATDEVRGSFESKDGERVRVPGVLEAFNLSVEDAEQLILRARVAAGWIEAPEPEPEPEPEAEYAEEGEADAGLEPQNEG